MTFRSMGCEIVVRGASGDDLSAVADLFGRRDAAFSRFRDDSELNRVNGSAGNPVLVSDDFARMATAALAAARSTGGLVTPTTGAAVIAAGYDRDFEELGCDARPPAEADVRHWRRVGVTGRWLFRDGHIELDLNGVVKGATVDDALALLEGGGSVSAGGDIATSRPASVVLPNGETITLYRGGLATSGTDRRRWERGDRPQHHLIDPLTGRPAASPWRLVTVAAGSCLAADVAAKAAFLLGPAGPSWLDRRGLPGRFLDEPGRVLANQTWTALTSERKAA
jgi:thiamine biosynthesis lipoprotein